MSGGGGEAQPQWRGCGLEQPERGDRKQNTRNRRRPEFSGSAVASPVFGCIAEFCPSVTDIPDLPLVVRRGVVDAVRPIGLQRRAEEMCRIPVAEPQGQGKR